MKDLEPHVDFAALVKVIGLPAPGLRQRGAAMSRKAGKDKSLSDCQKQSNKWIAKTFARGEPAYASLG